MLTAGDHVQYEAHLAVELRIKVDVENDLPKRRTRVRTMPLSGARNV